jgi:ribosomal protein L37AE/L43A
MKKSLIWMIIVLACIFVASCEFETVHYCPYCQSLNITETPVGSGIYKCNNESCGKTFGAKKIEP